MAPKMMAHKKKKAGHQQAGVKCGRTMAVMTAPTVSLPWNVASRLTSTAPSAAAAPSPVEVACAREARGEPHAFSTPGALSLGRGTREKAARAGRESLTRLSGGRRGGLRGPGGGRRAREHGSSSA